MRGPLQGYRIVELTGLGPAPFAGMVLSDMGAEVLRIDRSTTVRPGADRPHGDVLARGRRSVAIDLKTPGGVATVLRLVDAADALIEGFRPGVTERLGIGPDQCRARNPRLVYGRMTGWGQDGPLARTAGHDIDYIALSGALGMVGRTGQAPVPPVNMLGDFGGGGMLLAFGVVCALLEAGRSGEGQVVDAAMVDGSALLGAMIWGFRSVGEWGPRGTNLLDTGAWFYDVYQASDGGYLAVGAIEPQFCAELLRITGLDADVDGRGPLPAQYDRARWPEMRHRLAAVLRTRTRDEWGERFAGTDSCVMPILDMGEAAVAAPNVERKVFVERDGVVQPAPAPRFSRTPAAIAGPPAIPGEHTDAALLDWGLDADEVAELRRSGAVA